MQHFLRPTCRGLVALVWLAGGLLWLRKIALDSQLGLAARDAAVRAGLQLFDAEDGFLTLS